jgi:hypothetical protein
LAICSLSLVDVRTHPARASTMPTVGAGTGADVPGGYRPLRQGIGATRAVGDEWVVIPGHS